MSWGPVASIFALIFTILEALTLIATEYFYPEDEIDIARNFNCDIYSEDPYSFGDHQYIIDQTKIKKDKQDTIVDSSSNLKNVEPRDRTKRFAVVKPSLDQFAESDEEPLQKLEKAIQSV